MKKIILLLILCLSTILSFANHTKGGWMFYEYLGPGSAPNTLQYRITLKLYMKCDHTPQQLDAAVPFTIFNAVTLGQLYNISVPLTSTIDINNCSTQECHPCIERIPAICYTIATYELVQDLPAVSGGYIIAFQRCCRITGIVNLQAPSESLGETWTVTIPGSNTGGQFNSSARFTQNDTAIICEANTFLFDFSAVDPDGDSLVYEFAPAYTGGGSGGGGGGGTPNPNPASSPPYTLVPYSGGFSASSPLGGNATIDRKTGIVSGIAPSTGIYVVTAVVSEYNRTTGLKIGEVRKSLHIEVADCNATDANLDPVYTSCATGTGFTVAFKNNGSNSNIQTYNWEFGDGNTSTLPEPNNTYAGPGDYILKLVVNRGLACSDSTTSIVKVYPGFDPAFDVQGQCTNTPVKFTDQTFAQYPVINSWQWNFGDPSSPTNTSTLQIPSHIFTRPGKYDVAFIVGTSKGCIDTLVKNIEIFDQPPLELTNDTLICTIDTLQLNAVGTGTFLWTPNYMISSISSPTPLVSPDVATTYHVQLTDAFGCIGKDSVKINVVNFVTQLPPKDTTICRGDAIKLNLVSDALYFVWTPNDGTITGTDIRVPTVTPLVTTSYHVVGSISNKCFAQNNIEVKVVDYPVPNVGPDIPLCLGKSTQLHASGGAYYNWTPALYLSATNIPNPQVVNPRTGVQYIVSVRDTLGCPKSVRDTIYVNVITIHADAGPSDTSVVMGQPLQLNATGGSNYLWNPDTWLTRDDIPNPVSNPQNDIKYVVTVSDANGCVGKDSINVHFYLLDAGIYVPNAFTPNGDGKNDVFRPIELGLKTLDLFRVYNRWGQLLYSTTNISAGWDGKFKGKEQDPAAYVWYAEGTDYKGIKVKKKGSVILIR